ncbi:hypothetical protein Q5P01_013292 [Channa striata]|uniref:Polycystic kidney disease protein 1-like 2 n=1 Tax=Channa striata TaxID=64152 RepID=A0AA88MJ19_CHASR|nr:hypothetical protein Q5P01_013292 [Channa striata]
MWWTVLHLLILVTLRGLSLAVSCPDHQKAFRGSCYEFVALQRSFFSAQAWCEQRGGHLSFIPNEETQHFLQRHLDPGKDAWFGIAPYPSKNFTHTPAAEASFCWLDGSCSTYSNWVNSPQPGAACGHLLRHSGFKWKATQDCNKRLPFICQFESGSAIVCAGHHTTLQCASGQVVIIDGGFYGRKNIHYCRATSSPPTTSTHQCSWVDVVETLKALCRGRQACQVAEAVKFFSEPCPDLGSYLSVAYQCRDGLTLTMATVAAVFHEVTITIKRLLDLSWGNVSCELSTGDGRVFYLNSPVGLESHVGHKYTHPGAFVVTVKCTSNDMHITSEKIISIQEPITEIGVVTCYAGNQFFHMTNCKALYGRAFQIQLEVNAGTNVTYRIQSSKMLLSSLSVARGSVPHNITVIPEMVKQLGPGCHQLKLFASNMVTFPELSADLQVCVLEKVTGLQASILTEGNDSEITVGVSLEGGAPVQLLFYLTGENGSFYEARQMNTRKEIFHIGPQIDGNIRVKLRAWNVFSSLEKDVFSSCAKDSVSQLNGHNQLNFTQRARKNHNRVVKSLTDIIATPSNSVPTRNISITLSTSNPTGLNDNSKQYQWSCKNPCKCQGNYAGLTHTITESCLPNPSEFNKYYFEEINKGDNAVENSKSICVILTASPNMPDWLSLTCTQGCFPDNENKDVMLKLDCKGNEQCKQVVWNIENPNEEDWPDETKSCYREAGKRPLIVAQNGGNELTVSQSFLKMAKSKNQDVKVVIYSGDVVPLYTTYTIKTSTSTQNPNLTPTKQPDTAESTKGNRNPKQLCCSKSNEVKSVFLPLGDKSSNYNLIITATVKKGSLVVSTTMITQVKDYTASSGSSGNDLESLLGGAVDKLKNQTLLSAATIGQLLSSVSSKLKSQSEGLENGEGQKLRGKMMDIMIDAVKEAPPTTPDDIQVIADGISAIIQQDTEPTYLAQEQASLLLVELSSVLLHLLVNNSEATIDEVISAASTVVEGASIILEYSSSKNISDALLNTLYNIQSALLTFKSVDEGPTIIQQANIAVFVKRVKPGSLHTEAIGITNCSCPAFSLPALPSSMFQSNDPVDVRMLSLKRSPFSWNGRGNISGPIGGLSLTTEDGSGIPVKNLTENIEILLPRPDGEQVNISVLDLGNYSTTIIDVPSTDNILLLKMVPSKDPLPFKVLLGYEVYPTETSYVAMTEMPHKGTTLEERYTWLLDPETLKGNTGPHYLVVRPIVGPGIKSINATLSITSISAACKFWDESALDWRTYGCKVGVNTTNLVTQCLCNHLTFFGSSFFVTPNLVDPSRTAELFATFAQNPVVVCFVGALFLAYLLVVAWARRKDLKDVAKLKVSFLEDNDPMDHYRYLLTVSTGHRRGGSTSSQVTMTLLGAEGNSEPHHLTDPKKRVFERGAVDMFLLTTPFSLGELHAIRLWHNNSGSHPPWFVGNVVVQDLQTDQKWHFLCNTWLAIDVGDCSLDKVFPISTEVDLKRFSNLFFMKVSKDFSDGHIWYSVVNRPPSSTFTCVQRVSCCFSLLLCTMLTSIMFYGIPTDPSEQVMELGNFEFTWQQFMIGVQSSLIMFPVNFLIVGIFRQTRPREISCCKRKAKNVGAPEQESTSQASPSQTAPTEKNVTLDIIINDITRIVHSLSKSVKHNIPCQVEPGQQVDINDVLSVMEDFIKQNNKIDESTQSETKSFCNVNQPHVPERNASVQVEDGIQRKSSKSQYLHRQLCHIHQQLSLLGPSGFPTPHSYNQALQQVQRMKAFLGDQIPTSSSVNLNEPTHKKLSPAESSDVFFALVIKKVDEDDFQNIEFVRNDTNQDDHTKQQTFRQNRTLYEPPASADIEKMKRNKILEQKAYGLLREILAFMVFLSTLLVVAYTLRDPNAFYLNQHILNSFTEQISETMSIADVFNWGNTCLLNNLFSKPPGFITDGNSKLLGHARLRQLRVRKNSCQIPSSMRQFAPDCQAPYSWEVEDMGSYDAGWNQSMTNNISINTFRPWTYQTQAQLRASDIWGKLALYRGGGFAAELGPDLQNASSTLEYLFNNRWLDTYTRAIIVEFTVYNANVNLFCIVTLLLETPAVGAFQFSSELHSVRLYQPEDGLSFLPIAAEIIYLLFILYYMFLQGKLMKQQRWAYFRTKWNLLELTIILLSWAAVAVYIKMTVLGNRNLTYYQSHKDKFASFYDTATSDCELQYLIAFLVLLTTVKLWHLLRLNPKMYMITATLQRASKDISSFMLVIGIMFLAYSVASYVIYGWKLSSYRTLEYTFLTLVNLQLGIFNYDEVLDYTPMLGALVFGSCIVLMTFVVFNLLVAVILVAFSHEKTHHKPSEEEEAVDLMLKKICSLFGIR